MSPDGSYRIQYKSKWKLSSILVPPYTLYVQGSERILYFNDIRKEDKMVLFYKKIPWTV